VGYTEAGFQPLTLPSLAVHQLLTPPGYFLYVDGLYRSAKYKSMRKKAEDERIGRNWS
jgi:hypothetical protein